MSIQKRKQLAIGEWKLKNLETIYESGNKAVYGAQTDEFGRVILKINKDAAQLSAEYNMLNELDGNGCCKVYAFHADENILLEERIVPGNVLRHIANLDLRINHFVAVFQSIHREVKSNKAYDIYLDWLNRTYAYCVNSGVDAELSKKMCIAKEIGNEMFAKYPERVLLHGDLPRFIMNELDHQLNHSGQEHIELVIHTLSKLLHYPISDIGKLFFMEVILGNVWCVEDEEGIDLHDTRIAMEVLHDSIVL